MFKSVQGEFEATSAGASVSFVVTMGSEAVVSATDAGASVTGTVVAVESTSDIVVIE